MPDGHLGKANTESALVTSVRDMTAKSGDPSVVSSAASWLFLNERGLSDEKVDARIRQLGAL